MNSKHRINNTSGAKGIHKQGNRWRSRIWHNKSLHLGYFLRKEDAIKSRKEAEKKYFGKYAYNY